MHQQGRKREHKSSPFPSPSLPPLPLPSPLFHFLSLPSPKMHLRSRPNIAAKASGERLSSPPPAGPGRAWSPNAFWCIFGFLTGLLWQFYDSKNEKLWILRHFKVGDISSSLPSAFSRLLLPSLSLISPPLPSTVPFPLPLKAALGSGSAELQQWGLGGLAKPQPTSNFDTI